MKITVLTPTVGYGLLTAQRMALEDQTFKDFEWIIIDDNYGKIILDNTSFPITHMKPKNPKVYPAIASACNDGLIYAQGELIYFMNDYILPHPECLARHWEIYQKYPKAMISGRGIQTVIEPVVLNLVKGDQPAADYRMWLFDNFFRKERLEDNLYEVFRDGVQNWWAGRNDSAPLEAILACNGFDETFDGRWGGQDADLAQRLMTYGLRYLLDFQSIALEFEHKHGVKPAIRSEAEQRDFQRTIIDYKAERGIYTSGIKKNLIEERKVCLKLLASAS